MSLKQRIKPGQIFNLLHLCLDAVIVQQMLCSATTPALYTARELGTNSMQQISGLTAKGSPTQSQGKPMNKQMESR
jgi:hypothetical protein